MLDLQPPSFWPAVGYTCLAVRQPHQSPAGQLQSPFHADGFEEVRVVTHHSSAPSYCDSAEDGRAREGWSRWLVGSSRSRKLGQERISLHKGQAPAFTAAEGADLLVEPLVAEEEVRQRARTC